MEAQLQLPDPPVADWVPPEPFNKDEYKAGYSNGLDDFRLPNDHPDYLSGHRDGLRYRGHMIKHHERRTTQQH